MSASIFNGDSVKILKSKLKFKGGQTVEHTPNGLKVTEIDGTPTEINNSKTSSVYKLFNADSDQVSNWTVVNGTLTLPTVAPHSGTASYSFASAVGGSVKRTITLPNRSKSRENSLSMTYEMDVIGGEVAIFDVANSAELARLKLDVTSTVSKLNLPYQVPSTATDIEVRIENTHASNIPVIKFDDLEFNDDPFVYKNLLIEENIYLSGWLSGTTGGVKYKTIEQNTGGNLISLDNTGSFTKITAVKAGNYIVTGNEYTSSGGSYFEIDVLNNLDSIIRIHNNTTSSHNFGSFTWKANVGDYLKVFTNKTISDNTSFSLSVKAQAEAEHLLTPVKTADSVGAIIPFANITTPKGFLYCDGTSYLRSDYTELFAAIGTAYGSADATHFNVPDLRGMFLRGQNDGSGVDPDALSRTALNVGGNTGDLVGSSQADGNKTHNHFMGALFTRGTPAAGQTALEGVGGRYDGHSTSFSGGNEARPKNVYVRYYIRFQNSGALLTAIPTSLTKASGVGSSAIYKVLDAESGTSDFINSGSGSIALEAANPHKGTQSYKFIPVAQLDKVTATVQLENRNKGRENSVSLTYEATGIGCDAVVYDSTNSIELERLPLPATTQIEKVNIPFFVKSTMNQVQFYIENSDAINHPTVTFDNVEFSDDPFVYKNLVNGQMFRLATSVANLTTVTGDIRLGTPANLVETGDNILVYTDSDGRFTATKDCKVSLSISGYMEAVGRSLRIFRGTGLIASSQQAGLNYDTTTSITLNLVSGEYVKFNVAGTLLGTVYVVVTAQAESAHVITPIKSNMTDWIDFPFSITGATTNPTTGTVDYAIARYRRVGQNMELQYGFRQTTIGTSGAGIYSFDLPTGLVIDTSKLNTTNDNWGAGAVGSASIYSSTDGYSLGIVRVSSIHNTGVYISVENAAGTRDDISSAFLGMNSGADVRYSFTASIPIVGWTSDAIAMGALPVKRVAVAKWNPPATGRIAVGTTPLTISIDSLFGDTSFLSLNTNQITLEKGTYNVSWVLSTFSVASLGSFITYIYNVTDSLDMVDTYSPFLAGDGVNNASMRSKGESVITLSKRTTIELRGVRNTTGGTLYMGDNFSTTLKFNVNLLFKLEKIK